jgi:hypothetical protein
MASLRVLNRSIPLYVSSLAPYHAPFVPVPMLQLVQISWHSGCTMVFLLSAANLGLFSKKWNKGLGH